MIGGWGLLAEDVVDVVEGERRRRRRAEDALAVEVAGERWRLSRVWRLRWRRRRLLRLRPRWLRPVVVGGGAAVRGREEGGLGGGAVGFVDGAGDAGGGGGVGLAVVGGGVVEVVAVVVGKDVPGVVATDGGTSEAPGGALGTPEGSCVGGGVAEAVVFGSGAEAGNG